MWSARATVEYNSSARNGFCKKMPEFWIALPDQVSDLRIRAYATDLRCRAVHVPDAVARVEHERRIRTRFEQRRLLGAQRVEDFGHGFLHDTGCRTIMIIIPF